MSNSLDPDQARQFVWPDLGPNCLQKSSADDTGLERVKEKRTKTYESLSISSYHPSSHQLIIIVPSSNRLM